MTELVWAICPGVETTAQLAVITPKAIGVSNRSGRLWYLPRSQVRRIEYDEHGDSRNLRQDAAVRSVEMPSWLARKKGWDVIDE